MSQTIGSIQQQKSDVGAARVDLKFEVALIPVSDVDRAKEFYTRLGFRLDDDLVMGSDFRVVQFTPPGSASSISFGKGVTTAAPGSATRAASSTASRRSASSTGRPASGATENPTSRPALSRPPMNAAIEGVHGLPAFRASRSSRQ